MLVGSQLLRLSLVPVVFAMFFVWERGMGSVIATIKTTLVLLCIIGLTFVTTTLRSAIASLIDEGRLKLTRW